MIAVFVSVGCVLVVGIALRAWPMINVVETGRTPEYPDIQPRAYRAGADQVLDAALHAVHRMPRWSLVSHQPATGEIRAEAKTLVWRFMDDILIRVRVRGDDAVVEVRSASRVGRGDFGQNARNIRSFLQELDQQEAEASTHR